MGHLRVDVAGAVPGIELQVVLDGLPGEFDVRRAGGEPGVLPHLAAQIGRQRGPSESVRRKKLGGDTLYDARKPVASGQQGGFAMHVDVDEPGADHVAKGIDLPFRAGIPQAAHGGDSVAPDGDIRKEGFPITGPVNHEAVADEDVERHRIHLPVSGMPAILLRRSD